MANPATPREESIYMTFGFFARFFSSFSWIYWNHFSGPLLPNIFKGFSVAFRCGCWKINWTHRDRRISRNRKIRIGVLGGGFAGLYPVFHLSQFRRSDLDITLFDRTNYFLYTPVLHEVATGTVDSRHILVPFRKIVDPVRVHVHREEIVSVNLKLKALETVSYRFVLDYIVLANGEETDFHEVSCSASARSTDGNSKE